MIKAQFQAIDKATIDSLIAEVVPESRTLDYKEFLPGGSDSDKKEFLADVSSFANASGGDLIFGIKERRDENDKPTGEPQEACGVEVGNTDTALLRLENMIRDGIDPRIPGVMVRCVDTFPKGVVIVMRIPQSWTAPHMVQASSRFYSRNSRGKYPLDVREIRAAFGMTETLTERIRRFRDDRLCKIIANETPVPLQSCPKIVLHLIPLSAIGTTSIIAITKSGALLPNLHPIGSDNCETRFNLDGFLVFSSMHRNGGECYSYVQLFRTGALEAVEAELLFEQPALGKNIPSIAIEERIIQRLDSYLGAVISSGVQYPILIMLSLVGVKGYRMGISGGYRRNYSASLIDRDVVVLPEIIVEDGTKKAELVLRPIFDALWQAAGWQGSMNYDNSGNWVPYG